MPRRFRAAVYCLMLLLVVARASASAQYHVDTWTTENGLPQASVYNVRQTPDGFLWIATLGGLVRFDGVNFRTFDTTTNPELSNSRLAAVFTDSDGNIWVNTQDRELMRFRDGTFEVMGAESGLPAKAAVADGRYDMQDGRLLILTSAGVFTWRADRFERDRTLEHEGMQPIGKSRTGARWFADAAGVAHRFEGGRETRSLPLPPDSGGRLYEDRAGRLWLLKTTTSTLMGIYGDVVHDYGAADGVPPFSTLWVLEEADGTLWFAEPSGLVRFRDGRFTTYTKAQGLPSTYVNSVFVDREGSRWVSTQGGLARLTEQPIAAFTVANGLVADNTYPILQDRRGDIWIGGWPGLTRVRNGVFENMSALIGGPRNVLSLMEDRSGAIWVGAWGAGVWRIDPSVAAQPAGNAGVQFFPAGTGPAVTFAIYQGRGTDIWFGSDYGARRYHDGVFDRPLQTGAVNTFYEDARGTLWMGTERGLATYADAALREIGEAAGFSGHRVRVIHPDAEGALWIGTYDSGLFRYRDGKFTQVTTRQGLPTNGAFQILEDDQHRFWISSNIGIYRVAKADLDLVADGRRSRVAAVLYGRDEGMANQEANGLGRPAGMRANDGRLWFPTQGGVAVIDPARITSLAAPPVSILDVLVDGVSMSSRDAVEIRSGNTPIEVRYAALTFVRPDLAQFRYRIDGITSGWVDAGTDRRVRFASLPFGDFRLRIAAANRDGVWNEDGAGIDIHVIPPFWRTNWFMALLAMAVMGAGLGAHRVRLGVLERRQALQQAFARQLIDSQETDRKRIASELHDGVSQTLVVIRNWASMSAPSLPEASPGRKRLGEIADAASQALGEVREVVQDLVPYHLERQGLVEAIRETAARVSDASGIAITCRLDELRARMSADQSLRLFRVVQESLNNMVKHSGATSASIDASVDAEWVRLTMRDNGKGFDPASVTPTTAGDGFGLVGMSERTRMMGGQMTIDSAPGRGTSITISVPSQRADSNSHR